LVDKTGAAVVLKNNTPRYIILDFALLKGEELASTDETLTSARRFIEKHLPAFEELAK
jgi:antitoxin Phd